MSRDGIKPKCQLVSVLIVSNETSYLRETLDSVFRQDYCNFEIVLVLNGQAINQTSALELEYSNPKVEFKVVHCVEENIVRAKNDGLAITLGGLICIIDSDDTMPLNRIRLQQNEFLRNPNLVVLGGQLTWLGTDIKKPDFSYPNTHQSTQHSLYRFSSLPHPGVMFRKDKVLEVGGYRDKYRWVEDWDLWLRLIAVGEVYNLQIPTVNYRKHSNQVTIRHKKEMLQNSVGLLFSKLEIIVLGVECSPVEDVDKISHANLVVNTTKCVFGLKRPSVKSGIFGLKEVRRSVAGIAYQKYFLKRESRGLLGAFCYGLFSLGIDPGFIIMSRSKRFVARQVRRTVNNA